MGWHNRNILSHAITEWHFDAVSLSHST